MARREGKIRLFAHLQNTGTQMGGWRHPGASAGGLHDFSHWQQVTRLAEDAKFDAVFTADGPGFRRIEGREAFSGMDVGKLEPLTLLSALAVVTSHIGLVATASTSFNEPYNLARRFASIDHLSNGRAGWNAITSTGENEAHNFSLETHYGHAERYARAEEFVDVVRGLWDTWEDDAFLLDKESGRYFDPDKLHALAHKGRFFSVAGPLNIGRPPQGHPLVVQAGASEDGRRLGARTADAIFSASLDLEAAQAYFADMKRRVVAYGRDADDLKIMTGVQAIVGATEAEARDKAAYLDSLIPPALALSWLQMSLGGVDLSAYDLDGPLPDIPETKANETFRRQLIDEARRTGKTIRQLANQVSAVRGSVRLIGTAEQIADDLQERYDTFAADGFVINSAYLPGGLAEFIEHVVPVLRDRDLFRREYEFQTLRENLGLRRPPNSYAGNPELHVEPEIWGAAPQGAALTTV